VFKALIVDDVSHGMSELGGALADAGCVDLQTASYPEALELLESGSRPFDIIVLDLTESHLKDVQRMSRAAGDLPLLVLCDERHVDSVLLAGAAECVTKPVRTRELLGRVRVALRSRAEERHQAQRERRMSEKIEELQRVKASLERQACVDPLTGVANRRHALSLLDSEWRRSLRDHSPLGVVMIDLDCYHAYNEQYGHLGGDECLGRVAEAMVKCLRRPSDLLGRYGGEEFIASLPGTDAVGAKIVAERLRASVEALAIPHIASRCGTVVTITAGFASFRPTSDLTMDRLIAAADNALLRAKAQGRNRVEGDAPLVRPTRVSAQRWQRFEPVLADPWLADRIPSLLDEAHAGARTIVDALRTDDPRTILRTATPLLAAARELGMPVLEKLLADLEHAASTSELATAREAADELIQYVTHVQVIYRRANAKLAVS
jgi:two-component system chemotaxis family response regulator WspR